MGLFSDKCTKCGHRIRKSAKYCSRCGGPSPSAWAKCDSCGAEVGADSAYCWRCGRKLAERPSPALVEEPWARADGDFAARVDDLDLAGCLEKGIIIEHGTKALLFQRGALRGVLEPGAHDLAGVLKEAASLDQAAPASAVLVDAGDVTLTLGYVGVRTREDVAVNATVELIARLADAEALYTNLMHGRQGLATEDLLDLLRSETLGVVQARLKQVSVKDLPGNMDLRAALESDLKDGLAQTLSRSGLQLVQLRFVDFHGDAYERVRAARGETFVAEEMATESERRAALNKRIRETLTRDRMDRFASGKDLEDFIRQTEHELGMKGVIRQAEMDDLKRTYEAKRDDAEIARKHLLEKLDLEHALAVRRMQRTGEAEELEHQLEQERKKLAVRQQAEWDQAQQGVRIRAVGHDQDVKEAEDGIRLLREVQAAQVDKKRAEQQIEIDRIAALSKLGTEALIAGSDAEKATLIAELKKTEMLKDYTGEQILAMAAEKSPTVADAFREKFRAMGSVEAQQRVEAMYEKMLTQQKEAAGDLTEVQREHARMLQELFQQTLAVQGQVASAAARGGQPQVVFPPPGSQPTVVGGPGRVTCAKCGAQSRAGAQFCEGCGATLG